jgi:hypothetical protein
MKSFSDFTKKYNKTILLISTILVILIILYLIYILFKNNFYKKESNNFDSNVDDEYNIINSKYYQSTTKFKNNIYEGFYAKAKPTTKTSAKAVEKKSKATTKVSSKK